MRIHVLQHVPFEDIGSMAQWLEARCAVVSYTRFFTCPALPRLDDLDLVVVLGGPMSVNDESAFPWLRAEKQFVHSAVTRGIPVLGVCLGAQIIAKAMGARVYPSVEKEIGWFPIEATAGGMHTFHFPERTVVFHWHGETFDLPYGAARLARSAACENQAFQIGQHVIGLQFHLETTPESAVCLVENCRNELVPGQYVQTETDLRNAPSTAYVEINRLMDEVLSYLAVLGNRSCHSP